jgi:hypothetical protein
MMSTCIRMRKTQKNTMKSKKETTFQNKLKYIII